MSYIVEALYLDGTRYMFGPFPTAEDATRWARGTRAQRDWLEYGILPMLRVA